MRQFACCCALVLASCNPEVPTPLPADVGACDDACAVLAEHACQEAQPSPGGVHCQEWCADYHRPGYMRPWAGCVALAADVDGIRACGVGCK